MAKQKQQQSAPPESEAQDVSAENQLQTEASIFAEPGPEPAPSTYFVAEAEIFLALLRGLHIEVKAGEEPSSTAERISRLHCDLVIKARKAGITIY